MEKQKIFCVISHTHWDREWYAPLEVFRHRLVDLFDRLLVILDQNPAYVFHLDAQTVVLEDYLAVRPEKRDLLRHYIQNRRLMIGPWYLQNDFYLTSGEATVRNLLEGDRLCAAFGGKGKVGYAPDQFGNISQLPQILQNFGIDNFVFGRGFSEYEYDATGALVRKPSPTEFIWQGADGTRVLAIHMRHWYNNAQRFSADLDKAERFLRSIEATFDNPWTFTPYLLLMNGVDHLEPQPDLLPVLAGLQDRLPRGRAIMQYNFDDYLQDVKRYIEDESVTLPVHRGELRRGQDAEILKGTLSSRAYLKAANVQAQILLENRLEPLYAMMERGGMTGVYPGDHLRYAWKNLLRNHPHDSICGCSRDEVHRHMENRYEEFFEFSHELLRRGLQLAADHTVAGRQGKPDQYLLTVANTLSVPVAGAVRVSMPFLAADGFDNFTITDDAGRPVPFMVFDRQEEPYDVVSPVNLPGTLQVKRYEAYVTLGEIAPYAFKTFTVTNAEGRVPVQPLVQSDTAVLQNEHLTVTVDRQGRVDITAGDCVARDCVQLEDQADIGNAYVFVGGNDAPILSSPYVTRVAVTEHNEYRQAVTITYELPLPADYDFERQCRSQATEITRVILTLSLQKNQPFAMLSYEVHNRSKWHRLRLVVDTGIQAAVSTADIPFDLVTHGEEAHDPTTQSKVLPNTSFAFLQNDAGGFAVMTAGTHEYEHKQGSQLAFTLVRATGGITRNPSRGWQVPGNQCLRTLQGALALAPFCGSAADADLPNLSLRFRAPPLAVVTSCDPRKFTGGRPNVQDSDLTELFYLPDAYPNAAIASNQPAVHVAGEGITVTAFKQAEDGSGLILRFVNVSDRETAAAIRAPGRWYRTTMAEKQLSYLGRNHLELPVRPKEIVTLLLRP